MALFKIFKWDLYPQSAKSIKKHGQRWTGLQCRARWHATPARCGYHAGEVSGHQYELLSPDRRLNVIVSQCQFLWYKVYFKMLQYHGAIAGGREPRPELRRGQRFRRTLGQRRTGRARSGRFLWPCFRKNSNKRGEESWNHGSTLFIVHFNSFVAEELQKWHIRYKAPASTALVNTWRRCKAKVGSTLQSCLLAFSTSRMHEWWKVSKLKQMVWFRICTTILSSSCHHVVITYFSNSFLQLEVRRLLYMFIYFPMCRLKFIDLNLGCRIFLLAILSYRSLSPFGRILHAPISTIVRSQTIHHDINHLWPKHHIQDSQVRCKAARAGEAESGWKAAKESCSTWLTFTAKLCVPWTPKKYHWRLQNTNAKG